MRKVRAFWRRLYPGERGMDLLLLGFIWLLLGFAIAEGNETHRAYVFVIEYLPIPLRVAIWWGAAAVAFITAWWPAGKDRWGFVALVIPPALRATSHVVAVISGYLTDDKYGYHQDWIPALSWVTVTLFVWRLARHPELPTPISEERVHGPGG